MTLLCTAGSSPQYTLLWCYITPCSTVWDHTCCLAASHPETTPQRRLRLRVGGIPAPSTPTPSDAAPSAGDPLLGVRRPPAPPWLPAAACGPAAALRLRLLWLLSPTCCGADPSCPCCCSPRPPWLLTCLLPLLPCPASFIHAMLATPIAIRHVAVQRHLALVQARPGQHQCVTHHRTGGVQHNQPAGKRRNTAVHSPFLLHSYVHKDA